MSKFTDQSYLKNDQYRDSSNLDARVELHRRFSTNPYGWLPWIFDTLETLPNPARVLELGCGPGYLWKECIQRIPAGWSITLSDLSDGMLDAAWRNLVVTRRAFKFEQIDAQSIPYLDETFDIVIANHMLYHVPDRPKALAEIRRVLIPDGNFITTTVGVRHLVEINRWLKQVSPDTDFAPFSNTFTLENGSEQLAPFFTRIEIKRYDDSLRVTELEPLIAYIRSTFKASELSESALENVRHELVNLLETESEILITKDSGLFKAIKN
jgi:ubiquinone/menaquinone biosynthesis C-methylase UbiE